MIKASSRLLEKKKKRLHHKTLCLLTLSSARSAEPPSPPVQLPNGDTDAPRPPKKRLCLDKSEKRRLPKLASPPPARGFCSNSPYCCLSTARSGVARSASGVVMAPLLTPAPDLYIPPLGKQAGLKTQGERRGGTGTDRTRGMGESWSRTD